jgi:Ca2+-binding EF-hand superfamily protein
MKEDINHDGQIDIVDITMVARAFGSKSRDQNWNPDADINNDGKVDDLDMYMVEEMFKKVKG